jgi:CubicO group peptidase (beta-lactamase class C family)
VAAPPPTVSKDLDRLLDVTFAEPETTVQTNAMLVVHRGRIVAERYAAGVDQNDTLPSWSMAKSILSALFGLLVRDGLIRIEDRAPTELWQQPGDPRAAITIDALLHMTSGLHFVEDYVNYDISDSTAMLYRQPGSDDTALYAADKPLDHRPDSFFYYSSGTSNILSSIARDILGGRDAYEAYLRKELFEPLGMTSASPKFDKAGSWVASTFCYCTARDFARFGLFTLRDGVWNGRRALPEGWVDYCRTQGPAHPTGENADRGYGAHWWLAEDQHGTFYASGYAGQHIMIVPALDLIVIRLGNTPVERRIHLFALIRKIIELFAVQ